MIGEALPYQNWGAASRISSMSQRASCSMLATEIFATSGFSWEVNMIGEALHNWGVGAITEKLHLDYRRGIRLSQ